MQSRQGMPSVYWIVDSVDQDHVQNKKIFSTAEVLTLWSTWVGEEQELLLALPDSSTAGDWGRSKGPCHLHPRLLNKEDR